MLLCILPLRDMRKERGEKIDEREERGEGREINLYFEGLTCGLIGVICLT